MSHFAIVERESELSQIDAALEAAQAGAGGLLVIEGPAGIGKTSLLMAARRSGEQRGFLVLTARGAELERESPYGMVRQLFERELMAAEPEVRKRLLAGSAALAAVALGIEGSRLERETSAFGIPHALYWLAANMAERRPLLLLVDDAHWADGPSLRFVAYLAHRLDGLPVCLAVATRPDEPGADMETLVAIARDPLACVLRVPPLSEAGIAALLADRLDGAAAVPRFVAACLSTTGGNPLLLRELIGALDSDGVPVTDAAADRVGRAGPRAVSRSVLLRIGNLDPALARLAAATAVLGDAAELRHAAAVAGIDIGPAAAAADALADVDILERRRPLSFIHPIVRTAVYADLAPGERSAAHARAAAALAADGVPPETLAPHLLATEAAGDVACVEALRSAAIGARRRGAPEAAVRYLRRALAEPPPAEERARVLAELGSAERLAGRAADAIEHLEAAAALTPPGLDRARRLQEIARATLSTAGLAVTLDRFEAAIAEAKPVDAELAREMEAEMAGCACNVPRLVPALLPRAAAWERLAGDSRAELALLACAGRLSVVRGRRAADTAALVRRSLAGDALLGGGVPAGMALYTGLHALSLCDELDEVDAALARAEAQARLRGDVIALLPVSLYRAMLALRRGRPRDAEADANDMIATTEATMLHPTAAPMVVGVLMQAQLEQGRPEEAERTLAASGLPEEVPPDSSASNWLLHSRALLRQAQDRHAEALADALAVGERDEPGGLLNPWIPWRVTAATSCLALGREANARRLADEWLEIARGLEVPGTIGQALRCKALTAAGARERATLLEEAVAVLSDSPARRERALALYELGATLRRAGRRGAALDPLREAHDIALAGGTLALYERVRAEMRAAGARPRRRAHSGVDALTASERRVAEMAARGDTNKEIAQALVITPKTVENHLGRVYMKLDVHSRAALGAELAADPLAAS